VKKQLLMSVVAGFAGLVITANANAAVEGPYIGGALGWGTIHQNDGLSSQEIKQTSSKDDGLAGRIFAGMQLNQNWSLEAGYSKFTNGTANFSDVVYDETNGHYINVNGKGTIKSYAVDAVAKVTIPLQDGFNIYGKVGGAYLNEAGTVKGSGTDLDTGVSASYSVTKTYGKILPTFGLGAGYDVNKNVTTDVSWMHIQKVGNTQLANTDLIAVGLTYHIG
jgi:OmpA-OmpF porin, OOP family